MFGQSEVIHMIEESPTVPFGRLARGFWIKRAEQVSGHVTESSVHGNAASRRLNGKPEEPRLLRDVPHRHSASHRRCIGVRLRTPTRSQAEACISLCARNRHSHPAHCGAYGPPEPSAVRTWRQ